ncbi:MAG: nitrite reductase large subunit NirB [Actinomycetota bacterium]|nr:nitrite reductase large subunit NirB [Actinomycetota bacterium]
MGRRTLVVAGHGMVGHKLLESLVERGGTERWDIVTFCEERRPAYDRVALSSFFTGTSAEELSLVAPGFFDAAGLEIHLGDPLASIDRQAGKVVSARGTRVAYDALVLATGSYPFVPPVPGHDLPGCFVYRTIDDLEAIRAAAAGRRVGAVVGGGLLGLEAANALRSLGLETHVVEFAPRLMPVQVDDGGGSVLRRRIEALGVAVHTGMATKEIVAGADGRVAAMRFAEGDDLPVDLVVFSAGIRPRDQLARDCGLEVGERGGVVVDEACRTSDPRIYAIGECAVAHGRTWGLVAPGYQMARVVADRLLGGDATFAGGDMSTKLKLMGIDVASFGDAFGATPAAQSITFSDPVANVYKRLVVSGDGARVLGGILVGDASMYPTLVQMARGDMPTPPRPDELVLPAASGDAATTGVDALAATATVCSCNNVTKGAICAAVASAGCTDLAGVKAATAAGTGCGGCVPLVTELLNGELRRAGVDVRRGLCEHFDHTRQELFELVRVQQMTSFSQVLAGHGRGLGCEVCKPAVASMLASLGRGSGYILDGEQASLQDTNDHFLANLQRDGTYSVVPRVPGGEITPDQLITIGQVAKEFGLYTKITGGQRIDLFGARVDQLPAIWRRLVDVGMESGHAYGKALRTVKSCVGSTWCRYGVQDSTTLAIELELRYRGLRAPHKIKSAVSGCTRECAEAQSKDFGVIATEKGWNLYVCGNGGMRPQHAQLLAADLDTATLVRYIDRFLMYYIRTADRLERTATWCNKLEGGIDHIRRVVVDDALGIAGELEAEMARHVESYRCEWRETIEDPERMRRFRTFVNADEPDPDVVFVPQRGQIRPAFPAEKAGPDLVEVTL